MGKKIVEATRVNFAQYLDQTLRELGLSRQQLAEELHVKKFTVDSWTRNPPKIPAHATFQALCQLLEQRKPGAGAGLATAAGRVWTPPAAPTRVPAVLNAFWGRQADLQQIGDLLVGSCRLVTLTGPGGVGKTRLAFEAARQLTATFPDGVVLIPLETVRDPTLLAATIARSLRLPETGPPALGDRLAQYLAERHLLLVLDNFEQLLEGTELLAELLGRAPRLFILVTSREPLKQPWEQQFAVEPLPLPDPAAPFAVLRENLAIQLFVDRARQVNRGFTLTTENAATIAAISQRLDGLPLALELAAGRSSTCSPEEMLQELAIRLPFLISRTSNPVSRQQTMRDCIAWSYDRLEPSEQHLLRQLTVFNGGCTLEAAVAVTTVPPPRNPLPRTGRGSEMWTRIRDLLTALVEKNLLRHDTVMGETRFTMLETIREYAAQELLVQEDTVALAAQHTRYFLELAEKNEAQLSGPQQGAALNVLEREHDNLRTVLDRADALDDGPSALRLIAALWRFWDKRGHQLEGWTRTQNRPWLERLAAGCRERTPAPADAVVWAPAFVGVGVLALMQHEYETAQTWFNLALHLYQALGNLSGQAITLGHLGFILERLGEAPTTPKPAAMDLYEQSLALYKEAGDQWGMARSLFSLGRMTLRQGDYSGAYARYEQSLRLFRNCGDTLGIAQTLHDLGVVADFQTNYVLARHYYEESLTLFQELKDTSWTAAALSNLGWVAACDGDYAVARTYTQDSLRQFENLGKQEYSAMQRLQLGMIARCEGAVAVARPLIIDSFAAYEATGNQEGMGTALHQLGHLALQRDNLAEAVECFASSLKLWQAIGDHVWRPGWNLGCLVGLAEVILRQHTEFDGGAQAARLLGAITARENQYGVHLQPADRLTYERLLVSVHACLDAATFAEAWASGQTMTVDQAISYALEETSIQLRVSLIGTYRDFSEAH